MPTMDLSIGLNAGTNIEWNSTFKTPSPISFILALQSLLSIVLEFLNKLKLSVLLLSLWVNTFFLTGQ